MGDVFWRNVFMFVLNIFVSQSVRRRLLHVRLRTKLLMSRLERLARKSTLRGLLSFLRRATISLLLGTAKLLLFNLSLSVILFKFLTETKWKKESVRFCLCGGSFCVVWAIECLCRTMHI